MLLRNEEKQSQAGATVPDKLRLAKQGGAGMSKEYYDLTKLKEYVEKEKIMDKFTPEQRADIQAMADELSKVLQSEEEIKWRRYRARYGASASTK